jgi:hypothetical protein
LTVPVLCPEIGIALVTFGMFFMFLGELVLVPILKRRAGVWLIRDRFVRSRCPAVL